MLWSQKIFWYHRNKQKSQTKIYCIFRVWNWKPKSCFIFLAVMKSLRSDNAMSLSPYVRKFLFFFNLDVFRVLKSFKASRECIWFKHYLSKLGWWVSAIADLADAGGVGAQNYGTVAYVIFKCSLITTIPRISLFLTNWEISFILIYIEINSARVETVWDNY